MEGLIVELGKGTYGNGGEPINTDNLWEVNKSDDSKENLDNKAVDFSILDAEKYPSTKAVQDHLDDTVLTSINGAGTSKSNVLHIAAPIGGKANLHSSNITGAIKIKFPVAIENVANYSLQIQLFGQTYNNMPKDSALIYISGRTDTQYIEENHATILTGAPSYNLPVRMGNDGTNYCIWIGNTDYIFQYITIGVSNLYVSRITDEAMQEWKNPFDISRVQTFDTVSILLEDNLPVSKVGKSLTGTDIDLSNVAGNNYNYASFSNSLSYTTVKPVVNGVSRLFINAASEPVVYLPDGITPATKLTGSAFVASTNMEIVVSSPDGVTVEYYFLTR